MRKLIMEQWVSMDGFVADKNGSLDFFTNGSKEENVYSDADQIKFLETVDTMILGRVTHDLFVDFWPTATNEQEVIADKLNSLEKFVFSNSLKQSSWGKWSAPRFLKGNVIEEVKKLKNGPGKHIVLWGSISISQELMQANVIDEYHVRLCPVIVGGGRSLFAISDHYINLKLTDTKMYPSGVMYLNYVTK